MKKIWNKEKGFLGEESLIWWGLGILVTFFILWFVIQLNYGVAGMAWQGFLNLMRPEHLFPDLLNLPDYEKSNPTGISGMMSGAVYLNGIILKDVVNGLVILMFYLVGMVYLYADLFEQFLGRMKSIIPKILIALILAYSSLYIIQFLMILGKYAYLVLYNIHTGSLGYWQNPDFFRHMGGSFAPPASGIFGLEYVEKFFLDYIWSFLSLNFSVMLLMTVTVRDVALAVLIVLIPIASILLMSPWTQQIGSRLWYLTIDLIFLPFVMIIPLMLIGPVANRISFVIAGLVVSMGSIYLIAKEPLILSGMGFGRAGEHLSRGVSVGTGAGNIFGSMGMTRASMTGGRLMPDGAGLKGGIGDMMGGRLHTGLHGAMSGGKGVFEATGKHIGAGMGLTGTYLGFRGFEHLRNYIGRKGNAGKGP